MSDARAVPGAPPVTAQRAASRPSRLGYFLQRNPRVLLGGSVVVALLVIALIAPWIVPYDPIDVDPIQGLEAPGLKHWLGTDDLGRDVLSRVVMGSRVSLSVGLISVSIGLAAGYLSGAVDLLAMRVIDALLAFPALLLAISITAALGPQIWNSMIAIGVVAIPAYARLTRAQVLSVREREYVMATRAVGATSWRIVTRHILPNISNSLVVQASLSTAFAILAEASLSFLGLGAQPPTPSWGQDINYSQRYLTNMLWWMSAGPGIAIFLAVLSFNFLGDALRDALDPHLRRRA